MFESWTPTYVTETATWTEIETISERDLYRVLVRIADACHPSLLVRVLLSRFSCLVMAAGQPASCAWTQLTCARGAGGTAHCKNTRCNGGQTQPAKRSDRHGEMRGLSSLPQKKAALAAPAHPRPDARSWKSLYLLAQCGKDGSIPRCYRSNKCFAYGRTGVTDSWGAAFYFSRHRWEQVREQQNYCSGTLACTATAEVISHSELLWQGFTRCMHGRAGRLWHSCVCRYQINLACLVVQLLSLVPVGHEELVEPARREVIVTISPRDVDTVFVWRLPDCAVGTSPTCEHTCSWSVTVSFSAAAHRVSRAWPWSSGPQRLCFSACPREGAPPPTLTRRHQSTVQAVPRTAALDVPALVVRWPTDAHVRSEHTSFLVEPFVRRLALGRVLFAWIVSVLQLLFQRVALVPRTLRR